MKLFERRNETRLHVVEASKVVAYVQRHRGDFGCGHLEVYPATPCESVVRACGHGLRLDRAAAVALRKELTAALAEDDW